MGLARDMVHASKTLQPPPHAVATLDGGQLFAMCRAQAFPPSAVGMALVTSNQMRNLHQMCFIRFVRAFLETRPDIGKSIRLRGAAKFANQATSTPTAQTNVLPADLGHAPMVSQGAGNAFVCQEPGDRSVPRSAKAAG